MRCEAWIGQYGIERPMDLAGAVFESFARELGSWVKRRHHDKTFARQRRQKIGIGERSASRFDRSSSAMREKNNRKTCPGRDGRVTASGNNVGAILKG